MRGTLGFSVLRFWLFFLDRFFGFCANRLRFFPFWCSLRFADFSFFSIWFSVFVEVTCGFSVLLCDVVFGFSYFVLFVIFGLAEFLCGFAVLDDFSFGFAVSNIPQCPPLLFSPKHDCPSGER